MNYLQSSRWIRLGLAVLASNLPTTVNAATLDDYVDDATAANMSQEFTSPDLVEETTDDSTTDIPSVDSTIEPEQVATPAFTINLQPADVSHEQSVPLAEENEVDNTDETSESISEETTLTKERVLESVTIAASMSQGFTVPSSIQNITIDPTLDTAPIASDIELEQPASPTSADLQLIDDSETSEPLSEEIEPSEESSSESVETSNALPNEALPMTRVISPAERFGDMPNHVAPSNNGLNKFNAQTQSGEVPLPQETIPTTATTPLEISEPSVRSEEVLIAQVIPDDTLGTESSVVVPNEVINGTPANVIEGGAARGTHLFHSFDEFNVADGHSVYFASPGGILTILGRVTGDSTSNIDGMLGVDGSADLFLLNPNGIVFGPNAELDIRGSFVASTAESINFGNGIEFSATNPNSAPLLNISVTPGLQYGSQASSIITSESPTPDENSTLQVGRDLTLGAQRLELVSHLEAGRDIILQGEERLLSEAEYTTGGYLFTQNLNGEIIDFLIPHNRVIMANGDLQLNDNYDDPSLYILAGGQFTHKTANENNIISIQEASDGNITQEIDNGIGGRQSITVNSNDEPIVDIRSGIDWDAWGGLTQNRNDSGREVSWGKEGDEIAITGRGITLEFVQNEGGAISLMSLSNGDIQTGTLRTPSITRASSDVQGKDAGDITLSTGGNIVIGFLDDPAGGVDAASDTGTTFGDVVGGDGGDIIFQAGGNIDVFFSDPSRRFSSRAGAGTNSISQGSLQVGEAGDISLSAGGDINIPVGYLEASSFSVLGSTDENTSSNNENAPSSNEILIQSSTSGYGGNINLSAGSNVNIGNNNIDGDDLSGTLRTLSRFTVQPDVSNLNVLTGGDGGEISVEAGGDIVVGRLTSNAFLLSLSTQSRTNNIDQGGNAGDIHLKAGGDIQTGDIEAESLSRLGVSGSIRGGDGGDIFLQANGDIQTGVIRSYSFSNLNLRESPSNAGNVTAGNGGDISLSAQTGGIEFQNDYDLVLMSLDSADVLPNEGQSLVIVAKIGGSYHARIFDRDKNQVIDKGPGDFLPDQMLVEQLDEALRSQSIENQVESELIQKVASNLDYNLSGLYSFSLGTQPEESTGGSSGDIYLEAATEINGPEILTFSPSEKSGNIQINGLSDLNIIDTNTIASRQSTITIPARAIFTGRRLDIPVGGQGQSGNAILTSLGDLTFTNSSFLNNTNSFDPAGEITINSSGWIVFDNTLINSSTNNAGRAGNINIDAGQGVRFAGVDTQLEAQTNAGGRAGDIEIKAPQIVAEQGAQISTATSNQGQAGNITLNSNVLSLTDGGEIRASTSGEGNSGTITVNASSAVNLGEGVQNFEPIISVVTSDAGQAGNIFINTPNFNLSETARITATSTESATNPEGGGSITLSADQMNLAGIVGIFAETQGQSPGGVLTLQPYRPNPDLETTNPNLKLDLERGAVISASTTSSGNGGNLQVLAPETIDISGPGLLAVETSGSGSAGNITAEAQRLILSNGVTISASTTQDSTGSGGNITLNAETIELRNGGQLAVSSDGEGTGGNIVLTSDRLSLNNGQINANTRSSDGGNITLTLQDLLTLRNGSLISTEAGTADAGGNGGNINIKVADGFVIAVPIEDNDIIANAFEGNGGEVNITANRILGLTPRSGLRSAELRGNASSDVSASSELGLNGEIDLLNLLLDPSQGLTELPANVEDPTNRIARGCRADDIAGDIANPTGDFVITGRNGQPLNPSDSADDATTLDDLGPVDAQIDLSVPTTRILEPTIDRSEVLEDAQKAIMTDSGDILLVANDTWHSSVSCSALR